MGFSFITPSHGESRRKKLKSSWNWREPNNNSRVRVEGFRVFSNPTLTLNPDP